ncbi:MAG: GNAT family N-acetyltransferase, partial [Actinobacteria bacterium]|nr:GNAT family N-acetyltransferase [Actinomycetota bacterium]
SCTAVVPGLASSQVTVTAPEQFEMVMPACIAMFTEELGVSPLANGMHAPYHARVRELIEQGRSYSLIERGEVVFKAEVGAAALGVAQLQGVWVAPDHRGQGHGVAGVAAVTTALLAGGYRAVTLYANEFNARALHVYEQVGFVKHDTFATVLR